MLQGLTLPLMIQRLGIAPGPDETYEEMVARPAATQDRSRRFVERASPSQSRAERTQRARHRRLMREVVDAERSALIDLRDQDIISDDVMRRVARELDLEEVRLEPEDGEELR